MNLVGFLPCSVLSLEMSAIFCGRLRWATVLAVWRGKKKKSSVILSACEGHKSSTTGVELLLHMIRVIAVREKAVIFSVFNNNRNSLYRFGGELFKAIYTGNSKLFHSTTCIVNLMELWALPKWEFLLILFTAQLKIYCFETMASFWILWIF